MKGLFTYKKISALIGCVSIVCLAFGAIGGKIDGHADKFSLKSLHVNKPMVFSNIRLNAFTLGANSNLTQTQHGKQWQMLSMIRLENGNTTYVYPYKYNVKVPKFKTPTPPSNGLR